MTAVRRIGPRRLDLAAAKRALDPWVAASRGVFPQPSQDRRQVYAHLPPVDLHPIGNGDDLAALRKAVAQAVVDVAANFLQARPKASSHMHVAAVICAPNAEWSEVCVFFDPDYFQAFERRDSAQQRWTPLEPDRSLVREWGLVVPNGLHERGHRERRAADSENPAVEFEGEIWLIGD